MSQPSPLDLPASAPRRRPLPTARWALLACVAASLVGRPGGAEPVETSLSLMGQVRHLAEPAVDDPATGDDESLQSDRHDFTLRRLRIGAGARKGEIAAKALVALDRGKVRLLTGAVTLRLPSKIRLTVGQTKRLLAQAYLDGAAHQRLIERAALSDSFGGERDLGAVASWRGLGKRLEVRLAVWNGAGPNVAGNSVGMPWFEGRIDGQIGARVDVEEPEIGKALGLRLGAAASWGRLAAERSDSNGLVTRYDNQVAASATAAVRWAGLELRVEGLSRSDAPVDARTNASGPLPVATVQQLGVWGQLAWQMARHWQLAARVEHHVRDLDKDDRWGRRVDAGVSWRPDRDDDLKVQLGWQRRDEGRSGGTSLVTQRLQLQLQWRM